MIKDYFNTHDNMVLGLVGIRERRNSFKKWRDLTQQRLVCFVMINAVRMINASNISATTYSSKNTEVARLAAVMLTANSNSSNDIRSRTAIAVVTLVDGSLS